MDAKAEELSAIVQEIRDRVRARHPGGGNADGIALPSLEPLLHARDAAEAKVASIGTVNPRAPGLVNAVIQKLKRAAARALDWHVREQVEFNRAVMNCVQATLEALNESNRAVAALAAKNAPLLEEVRDVRTHWVAWRQEWERNLSGIQIQFLRSLSDLQGAWQHRVTLMDDSHRAMMKSLHGDFQGLVDQKMTELQKRLWVDLERIRGEYETIIHAELRLLRQKTTLLRTGQEIAAQTAGAPGFGSIDWLKFSEKFRGTGEYVKRHLELYTERFQGSSGVLDIGCGRGEVLETFRDANVPAHGIDLNDDCIALCRNQGFSVEKADLFAYLNDAPDGSLGGITCLQVVEHLAPERLPELIALAHAKLKAGALLAIETPNPECLAIFARHFYLDPTHAKPIPPALLAFYLEEAGFGRLETIRLEPAVESMPSLASLPEAFRGDFFGSLDYAIFGRKL